MNAAAGRAGVDGAQAGRAEAGGEPFPWNAALHAGLCLLRLSPREFWALTPIEFFAMAGGLKPRLAGLERAGLEALMQTFPD